MIPCVRSAVAINFYLWVMTLQLVLSFKSATAEADWQETGVRMGIQAGPKRE